MSKLLEMKKRMGEVQKESEAILNKSEALTKEDREAATKLMAEFDTLKSDIELYEKQSGITDFLKSGGPAKVENGASGNARFEGKAGTAKVNAKTGEVVEEDGENASTELLKATAEKDYKAAFGRWLRKSGNCDVADLKLLSGVTRKAMAEGIDTDGGVLVPIDIISEIIQRKGAPTSVVDLVRQVPTSRDKVGLPWFKYSTDDIKTNALAIQWTGEGQTATEDTSLQNWGFKEFQVFKGIIPVELNEEFLEDVAMPIEGWVTEMMQDAHRYGMENVIINGTGVNQPRGFLDGAGDTARIPTQNVGNPMTGDGMIDLNYALPAQYATNAVYVARRTVIASLAKLKDTANNYIGLIRAREMAALANVRVQEMFGATIYQSEYMPAGGSAAKALAYGDLRQAYALVTRLGVTITPYGEGDKEMVLAGKRGFRLKFRTGGDVLQDRAMVIGVQS